MDQNNLNNNELNNNVQPVAPTPEPMAQPVAPVEAAPAASTPFDTPPQPVPPVTPGQVPPQGVVPQPEAPKKKSVLPIILIVVLIAAIAAVVVLFVLPKQPKKKVIVDKTIDTLFSKALSASQEADRIVNEYMKVDLNKEPFHMEGKLNMTASGLPADYKEFEKIKDYDFTYDLNLNVPKEKFMANVKVTQNGKSIIDLKSLIEKNMFYLEEKSIFGSNPVKTDLGSNMFDTFKVDEVTSQLDFKSLTKAIQGIEKHLKSAIPVDMIKTEKASVNGVNATKTYIEITKNNVAKIYENFYNSAVNDANLLEELSVLSGESIDKIKEELKAGLDEIKKDPSDEKEGELAVYTDSSNKLVKLEVVVEDQKVVEITNNNGVYTINSTEFDEGTSVTYTESTNTLSVVTKEFSFELSYKDENFGFKADYQGVVVALTVKSKNTKDSYSSDINLSLKITEGGQTVQLGATSNSLINKNDATSSINTGSAIDASSLDMEQVNNNLSNALSGTIFESLITMMNSYSSPSYSQYSNNSSFDDFEW